MTTSKIRNSLFLLPQWWSLAHWLRYSSEMFRGNHYFSYRLQTTSHILKNLAWVGLLWHIQLLFFFLIQFEFSSDFRQPKYTFVLENSHCKIFTKTQFLGPWGSDRAEDDARNAGNINSKNSVDKLEKHSNIYGQLLYDLLYD